MKEYLHDALRSIIEFAEILMGLIVIVFLSVIFLAGATIVVGALIAHGHL